MSCECHRSIEESLTAVKSRMMKEKSKLLNQLEEFKEGIKDGFRQLVAKHLFKAGVYFASLDNDLSRSPRLQDIMNSLIRRVSNRDERLLSFVKKNALLIEQQVDIVDVKDLLEGILRLKEKAKGLLEGNGERELQEAERAYDRLEKLERYFSAWREGLLERIDFLKIVDMHD